MLRIKKIHSSQHWKRFLQILTIKSKQTTTRKKNTRNLPSSFLLKKLNHHTDLQSDRTFIVLYFVFYPKIGSYITHGMLKGKRFSLVSCTEGLHVNLTIIIANLM